MFGNLLLSTFLCIFSFEIWIFNEEVISFFLCLNLHREVTTSSKGVIFALSTFHSLLRIKGSALMEIGLIISLDGFPLQIIFPWMFSFCLF